jgi:hypothetical protein
MPRELGVEVLQFLGNLFVAARLAGLALERADLPLHFADEVGDAQKILLGVFQFAERFFFCDLEFRDAGGFLENHPAVFRLAGKNLRDVALRHDAVARAADARAHEKLLDVLEPARRAVDEILAAAVAENPARERDLVVSHLDARRAQVSSSTPPSVSDTSPMPIGLRPSVPLKITSAISPPRKRLGRLLAEHPADGVGDIGFAAAVGADDGSDAGLKIQRGFVREGLEPKNR